MSTLDLTPDPVAAPVLRRVTSHALTETKLLVRNGEQLLLALVIPVGILVSGRVLGGGYGNLATLAPSVLGLAVWSSAFTSLAIATGFERRYGVLERLAATPLGKSGLLAGKALTMIMIGTGQLVLLSVVGLLLGWRPAWTATSAALGLILIVLAASTFSGLALLIAGRLPAEATLGLANVIYVLLLVGGGLVVPVSRYPSALRPVLELLPTAALGEGLRSYAAGSAIGWPLAVLGVWCVVAAFVAWKGFRWTS